MPFTKEDVQEKMKEPHAVLLNVLPEEEFQKLHITGSRNLPLVNGEENFAQAVEKKYGKERFFILHGSGADSHSAVNMAEALRRKGFKIESYAGGTEDWNRAGWPVEGSQAGKPAAAQR